MLERMLGEVPAGCRRRLVAHYGPQAQAWLDDVPDLLERAAKRWKLTLDGYHDAGHASIIAMAVTFDGRPLLLKAWPDPARYRHEVGALQLWSGGPTAAVVESADDLAVAALELVGSRPGGGAQPQRELQMVAVALQGLHTLGRRRGRLNRFPLLADHLQLEVLPRIRRRARELDLGSWRLLVDVVLPTLDGLQQDTDRLTVLHADLYRENIPFDHRGHPRLIDPLPMLGDAVFDWAFWTVYYDLGNGTDARLSAAARISRIPLPLLAPWCRALALDGFLFYLETRDPRAPRMADVLASLTSSTSRSGS
ncbi:aminoglycoside phosphotransferase family protein [Streptomyces sp. NPDC048638]|uniref:aminoglycoside phosphotransferase family protein n=1 Tax=Streptomyces sp. NPDC048638 TaxID=3365580 RepID=UPI0037179C56